VPFTSEAITSTICLRPVTEDALFHTRKPKRAETMTTVVSEQVDAPEIFPPLRHTERCMTSGDGKREKNDERLAERVRISNEMSSTLVLDQGSSKRNSGGSTKSSPDDVDAMSTGSAKKPKTEKAEVEPRNKSPQNALQATSLHAQVLSSAPEIQPPLQSSFRPQCESVFSR
jgi:hypothetical protein